MPVREKSILLADGHPIIPLYSIEHRPMLNFLGSLFRVRAAKLFSGLALTSLSLLVGTPAALAFSSVEEYFKKYPEQWPEFVKYMGEAEAKGLITPTVTGPSASRITADAARLGAGMAFPNSAGRLANMAGYSPSEIQKGLQRLADRYCLQNQVDCYGANGYFYVVNSPNCSNSEYGTPPGATACEYNPAESLFGGEPIFGPNYEYCGGGMAMYSPIIPRRDYAPCIDLSTLKVLPHVGRPKTFGDLTPEQKRQAIGLATPADFIPNPGGFDIPDDGTQLIPNGAPVFFPDPLSGDRLKPITHPVPIIENSQDEPETPGGGSEDGSAASPRQEDVMDGPHGPDRPIEDVVARAIKDGKPQGRWLSTQAGKDAVANLDVDKMEPGKAYSVPIPEGAGVEVRLYDEYPPSDDPKSKRYTLDPVDRAFVQRTSSGIHTFPSVLSIRLTINRLQ
jgi:hypothetical protein